MKYIEKFLWIQIVILLFMLPFVPFVYLLDLYYDTISKYIWYSLPIVLIISVNYFLIYCWVISDIFDFILDKL
jgi:hypothetical protein